MVIKKESQKINKEVPTKTQLGPWLQMYNQILKLQNQLDCPEIAWEAGKFQNQIDSMRTNLNTMWLLQWNSARLCDQLIGNLNANLQHFMQQSNTNWNVIFDGLAQLGVGEMIIDGKKTQFRLKKSSVIPEKKEDIKDDPKNSK